MLASLRTACWLHWIAGLASVVVETVWMRWLRELLGATAPAASATLVAFFLGQAWGAWWYAGRAPRLARPLAAYGRILLAAAGGALATPALLALGGALLAAGYDALRAAPALLLVARLALALVATLPAAFAFGASLPAIVQATHAAPTRLARGATALYAAGTLGAALGAAIGAFALPGRIGVRATYALALILMAAAGFAALRLAASPSGAFAGPRLARDAARLGSALSPGDARRARLLAGLAAVSGLCTFALQVLAVQALGQVLNGSIHAFGAVTITVLACLAAGSAVVALLESRTRSDPGRLLCWALAGAGLLSALVPQLLVRVTDGLRYVGAEHGGLAYLAAALAASAQTLAPAMTLAALVLPLVFALAGRAGSADPAWPGIAVGRIAAANTLGAVAGALCAPYWLMPVLGLWGAFLGVAAIYALAAALAPAPTARSRGVRVVALLLGGVALGWGAAPHRLVAAGLGPGERVIATRTTAAGIVQVLERPDGRVLRIDNHYALGGSAEQVHQARQLHLPLLVAPHARRVLHYGSATGISSGAALLHPLKSLTVVELVPGVVEAARHHFARENRGVYDDPRVEVVVDDAHNFVRATRARFDLIVADLFVPWRVGAGSLYSSEHFAAARERLTTRGVFFQWLPLYQLSEAELVVIAATFLDVFPQSALFRGDFYGRFPIAALAGFVSEAAAPAEVARAAGLLSRAGVTDRWVTDAPGVWALYAGPLSADDGRFAGAPRNRADRPWIEWAAAAGHAGGMRGKLDPVVASAWVRFAQRASAVAGTPEDPVFGALSAQDRRAVEAGALLQRAGALWVEGRHDAAGRTFQRAAALLPRRLVLEAPPDATAAELWRAE